MVKVHISTNIERKTLIVDGDKTVKEVLADAGVLNTPGSPMMDGAMLSVAELNSTFDDLGVADECYITKVAKQDNAAGVSVIGAVAVIESRLTRDQIATIKKFRPDALTVVDKNDEPVFTIGLANSEEGSLSKYGASFGKATSMNGYATITLSLGENSDPVGWIADEFGGQLNFILKLEENALSQLEEIETERAAVREMIARA